MADALITLTAVGIVLAAALHWAYRDDVRRHDHHIDEIIARRYTQPTRLRVWHDDNYSVPTSNWNYGKGASSGAGTDPLAASGCTSEQTAHAADRLQASVAHAGTEPTPSRRFGAPGGVGLLAPSRDTTPHPLSGRRRI